jgi:hypothetical protein
MRMTHIKDKRPRLEMRLLLTAAFGATLLSSVHGQTANQAQVGREVSRTQRPAPVVTGPAQTGPGAPAAELPQREEYGPLKVLYNARPLPTFSFQAFSGAYYTNNAALLRNHEIGEWYFQQGYSLGWSKPFLQSSLFPHVSLYQAWFEYTETGTEAIQNFSATNIDVGITYALRKLSSIALSVDYIYQYLAGLNLSDEIFHENHLVLGANKTFAISRTHSAFIQGFADLSLGTQPLVDERNEYGVAVGYSVDWIPEISTSLYYRYALYDYTQGPRQDNNQTFALTLTWRIRPTAFLQLGANYVIDNSNIKSFDYHVFNGGPTAGINIQW